MTCGSVNMAMCIVIGIKYCSKLVSECTNVNQRNEIATASGVVKYLKLNTTV